MRKAKRKFAAVFLAAIIAFTAVGINPAVVRAEDDSPFFRAVINGEEFTFSGPPPALAPMGTLLPVREIFEHLGFSIRWDPDTAVATLTKGPTVIEIAEGSQQFTVYGIPRRHENQPAVNIGGFLMVPMVEVIESIGGRVWRNREGVVHIIVL